MDEIETMGYVGVGKKYGVSDNAVRKWKKNYEKAITLLTQAASRGHKNSRYLLAIIYRDGVGTAKDYSTAIKYFSLLHDENMPEASYSLGMFYENGWGVDQDFIQAAHYYAQAAADGNFPEAKRALGSLYFSGKGVAKNLEKALDLYLDAADGGNHRAMYNLALMHEKGIAANGDTSIAVEWILKAAEHGND